MPKEDTPIVIVHNGSTHFAPTKPRRAVEVFADQKQRIFMAAHQMGYYLKREVPDPTWYTEAERRAWHDLHDATVKALHVFRPTDQSASQLIAKTFAAAEIPAMPTKPPKPTPGTEVLDIYGRQPWQGDRGTVARVPTGVTIVPPELFGLPPGDPVARFLEAPAALGKAPEVTPVITAQADPATTTPVITTQAEPATTTPVITTQGAAKPTVPEGISSTPVTGNVSVTVTSNVGGETSEPVTSTPITGTTPPATLTSLSQRTQQDEEAADALSMLNNRQVGFF